LLVARFKGAADPPPTPSPTPGTPGTGSSAGDAGAPGPGSDGSAATTSDSSPNGSLALVADAFGVTNMRFAPSRAATPLTGTASAARRIPRGTTFRFHLSEPAQVTISIERRSRGRRHRYVRVGTLRRTASAGTSAVRFTGRFGRRALRRGGYRSILTAVDAAGARSAAQTAAFRIVAG
jgi:hypothetical protein